MSDKVELAQAYVTIIPTTEGAETKIAEALTGAMTTPSKTAGAASGALLVDQMLGALGLQLPLGMTAVGVEAGAAGGAGILAGIASAVTPAAVVAAVAAIGVGLFKVGETFDEAFDTIVNGTGASGEALEALNQSFRNVSATVPNAVGDVADTIAEINTRTGMAGEALEDFARDFLYLGEIGYAADIDTVTGMMNSWMISTDDMSDKLNELFYVSQSTGIGMDELSSAMSGNAATMTAMGFTFEESAALIGQLDKAGLNATGMMGKLQKACTNLARDGEEPADAYRRIVSEMDNFIQAGDKASALNLATEMFGVRGAAEFLEAVETGAVDVSELAGAMEQNTDAIATNEHVTRSAGESFEILKNRAMLLLEPLGSAVFDAVGKALEFILDVLDELNPLFQELKPLVDAVATVLGGVFSAAVKTVTDGIEKATEAIKFFKGLFTGELTFPHIKIPHIHVSGGEIPWGIGGLGTKPTVNIEWYKTGAIATGASIVGVGEAGNEAIVPLEGKYMRPFAKAIAEEMKDAGRGNIITIQNMTVRAEDARTAEQFVAMIRQSARAYA